MGPPPKTTPLTHFDVVGLGGTFDHIHSGHKLMLSSAVLRTNKRIVVGVTSDELLKNKSYFSELESIE